MTVASPTAAPTSDEADRIARAGAPYPYPEPLPAGAQDAHARAVVRASRTYARCAALLGTPGVAVLAIPLVFRSWPAFVLFGCGVLALVAAAVAMPRLAVAARRHRAVLAAYDLAVTASGEVRPIQVLPVRGIAGDVRVEAEKALRTRRRVVLAAALVLGTFTAVWVLLHSGPAKPGPAATGPALGVVLLGGLMLLGVMHTALVRVVDASGGRIRRERITGLGGVLFVIAIFAGITAGNAAHASMKDAEPGIEVLATVQSCSTGGRSPRCFGTWTVDGEVYSGYMPASRPRGWSPYIPIKVSAEQPGIVLTMKNPWFARYGVLGAGAALALLGLSWIWLLRGANRVLRDAAAGHLPEPARPNGGRR
jgi:hypothetical protein